LLAGRKYCPNEAAYAISPGEMDEKNSASFNAQIASEAQKKK
jgi:hypothetical protein